MLRGLVEVDAREDVMALDDDEAEWGGAPPFN